MKLKQLLIVSITILLISCGEKYGNLYKNIGKTAGKIAGKTIEESTGIPGSEDIFSDMGFILGSEFAEFFTENEQKKIQETTKKSLDTGKTVRWESDENPDTGGETTIVKKRNTMDGKLCRTAKTTGYDAQGNEIVTTQEWCKNDDGSWEPIA